MRLPLLAALFLAFAVSPAARADTVYTYTGQPFTVMEGNFGDHLSGSFTLASPLGSNLSNVSLTPESYTFSDGLHTVTSSDSFQFGSFYEFATDAAGNITQYGIFISYHVSEDPSDPYFFIANNYPVPPFYAPEHGDISGLSLPSISVESLNNTPGVFTRQDTTPPSASTPEPSSIALLGTAACGVVGLLRRRPRRDERNDARSVATLATADGDGRNLRG